MSNPIVIRSLVTALVNARVYNAHSIIGKVDAYLMQSKASGFYPIIEDDILNNYMYAVYHKEVNSFSFNRPSQKSIDKSEAAYNKMLEVKTRKNIQSKYRSFIMARVFYTLSNRYYDLAANADNAFAAYRYEQVAVIYNNYYRNVCRLLNWNANLLADSLYKRYQHI